MGDNHRTDAGFRSRGERKIADGLKALGIPFEYEKPLLLYRHGKARMWYLDFTLPREGIYIEFFGMQGDADYDRLLQQKLVTFKENHLDVIALYPADIEQPDWMNVLVRQIAFFLERRLLTFQLTARSALMMEPPPSLDLKRKPLVVHSPKQPANWDADRLRLRRPA